MFFSARARRRTISSRFHPEYISGKFLLAAGCASKHERLVLFSASRKDSLLRKGDLAPTPNPSEMLRAGACLSFGSLKTEEKTERQCGQFVGPPSGDPAELSVNFAVGTPCRQQHGYRPSSTFVRCRFGQSARTLRPHGPFPVRMERSLTTRCRSNGRPRFCWRV